MTVLPYGIAPDQHRATPQPARSGTGSAAAPAHARHFLFLRGPFGSFFPRIAAHLGEQGFVVSKVVFDGGDLSDWGLLRSHATYRGPEDAWPLWIDRFMQDRGVTDLVVFNDCIEVHTQAIAVARRRGVRVHVFEEGYFRPRWITLEADGVNAYSLSPRDPEFYRQQQESGDLAAVGHADVGRPTTWLILRATLHYLCKIFLAPAFPRRRNPFALPVFDQIVGSILRYWKTRLGKPEVNRRMKRLVEDDRPFFLALMQRAGDSQLWRHSNYTNESFAEEAIASFSQHAPPQALLAFKLHPLDPGLVDYERMVGELAAARSMERRVVFLDGGNLNALARKAKGAVTINSTAGLATIGFGCPTKVLGRAVYDIEGLTDRKPLSRFWLQPQAPDGQLFGKFRSVMMARTQINGSFYTPQGIAMAARAAAERLASGSA